MIKRMCNKTTGFYGYMGKIFGSRKDIFSLVDVLKFVYPEVSTGTVPIVYREAYASSGYTVTEEKKNFLVVKGGKER